MKYLVVYYKQTLDNEITVHLWPGENDDECIKKFKMMKEKSTVRENIINKYEILDFDNVNEFLKVPSEEPDIKKAEEPKAPAVNNDYSKLSKTEMQNILKERGVRVFYHDTIPILREKLINSESLKSN